ncbi:hypothetical protein GWK47_051599 [Chionoecetes opilio]|uniref:Uncharacterized protein n=1 Tax=Chionoecetes opilio TaxID=41210 RepID=A0A8J5CRX8_CHIOP|nr:hypothetical protein GWK47_051599 [Chionoecetes opilio]
MVVFSRSPAAGPAVEGEAAVWWRSSHHSRKPSRVSALLSVPASSTGREALLYKAQIRPYLEYAALSWIRCSLAHSEAGQHPASSPATGGWLQTPRPPRPTSPLRADESSRLTGTPRGMSRRLWYSKRHSCSECHTGLGYDGPPRVAMRSTRTVLTSGDAVEVPRSRACQHQRTFVGRAPGCGTFSRPLPSHPGDEQTKCKVGGQSVETFEAHPVEASDTGDTSDATPRGKAVVTEGWEAEAPIAHSLLGCLGGEEWSARLGPRRLQGGSPLGRPERGKSTSRRLIEGSDIQGGSLWWQFRYPDWYESAGLTVEPRGRKVA